MNPRPAPIWTLSLILAAGGAMCLFAAAFPVSETAPVRLAAAVGAALLIAAVALFCFGSALPRAGLAAIAAAGTLTNSLLVASATTDYGAALNCFAYLWIAIYAGQFFEQRAVRAQCGLIAVASALALALSGIPGTLTAWVLIAGSCALAGEALARLNSRLRTQLSTDPLTGLLNRDGLTAAAERVSPLAAPKGTAVSVALIDLDEFKQVNDRHGHAAGDELLARLGRAWRDELRETEVLARLGGDEFALILPTAGAEQGLGRLRAVSPIGWSAGLVEWLPGESLGRTLARADEELYRAKRRSRERPEPVSANLAATRDAALS